MRIIILIFLISGFIFPQKFNPDEILKKVVSEYEKVNSYTADVFVKVDISYLKMPDINAKIYYKKPEKIHISSEGFAMLPKQGVNFSPSNLLSIEHTSIAEGFEEINGIKYFKIKIIPKDTEKGPALITLIIDQTHYYIKKILTLSDKQGKTETDINYVLIDNKYYLPAKITFTADIGNLRMPKKMNRKPASKPEENDDKKGTIYITYSNYAVNIDIDDKIFEENKTKK